MKPLPKHLSHSARETLERCAKSWMLKYLTDAPRSQSLWLAGGSAVHETTEFYDLHAVSGGGEMLAFEVAGVFEGFFEAQLTSLREKEPNERAWRSTRAEPDIDAWRRAGLQFVQSYIDWRERSPWEIWTTPDGQPAIELDISGKLPGCPVEIKAYLDRVFHDPVFDKLWIVDLKTSQKPPKTADQFGVYAALMRAKFGVDVAHGAAFMNRRGELSKPFALEQYTPKAVGKVFAEAWQKVTSGHYPAEGIENGSCYTCDVSSSCFAKGGPHSAQHDPDDPSYPPPY